MALGITVLENQAIESGTTTAAGVTEYATTAIDAAAGEKWQTVTVQVSIDFYGTHNEDANIHFRKSTDGGTTDSNLKTLVGKIGSDTSATQVTSFQFNNFTYGEFGVENLDSSIGLEWSAKFEGDKITGAESS